MEHNVSVRPVHIVDSPPSLSELEYARKKLGGPLARLFNTSGQLYREGNYKERLTTMTDAEALLELSQHGKLIKRPFLIGDDVVLVGFRADEYEDAFVSSARS
jgi:arsenate reductase (glutaredoxin)